MYYLQCVVCHLGQILRLPRCNHDVFACEFFFGLLNVG
jgi:hypothetical protein